MRVGLCNQMMSQWYDDFAQSCATLGLETRTIDIGPVGLVSLLAMLAYYVRATLSYRGPALFRWALVSFLLCNLVILAVSHNHLISFEGQCAFMLLFLLPTSEGLYELGLRRARYGH